MTKAGQPVNTPPHAPCPRAGCVQVLTLSQILRFDVETSVTERLRLEHLAAMALSYTFMEGVKVDDELRYFAGDEYKARRTIHAVHTLPALPGTASMQRPRCR